MGNTFHFLFFFNPFLFLNQDVICELLLVDKQEHVNEFCHRPLSSGCANRENFSAEQQIKVLIVCLKVIYSDVKDTHENVCNFVNNILPVIYLHSRELI